MSRQGSGSTLGSLGGHNQLQHFGNNNGGNAGWGAVDAPPGMLSRGGNHGGAAGFSMSGILRKNASESALNKSLIHNGKLMRKASSASRENLIMKRTGSNTKLLGSQENLHGLLPVRRHNPGLKHALGKASSRSVPHMGGMGNACRIKGRLQPGQMQHGHARFGQHRHPLHFHHASVPRRKFDTTRGRV